MHIYIPYHLAESYYVQGWTLAVWRVHHRAHSMLASRETMPSSRCAWS